MKKIDSGHGDSSDMIGVRERAWKNKSFRYIVISTGGGNSGMVGGSFGYEVHGTNNARELFEKKIIGDADEIIDTKLRKQVEKDELVRQFVKSLTKAQKEVIIDEMIEKFLTEQVDSSRR